MKAPDVQPASVPPAAPRPEDKRPPANARPARAPRPDRTAIFLALVAGTIAMGSLAFAAWIYADTRQEVLRLSTELAQTRLNVELRTRTPAATPSATAPQAGTSSTTLDSLAARLGVLEDAWRQGSIPATASVTPTDPDAPGAARPGEDCLPAGMRILVSAGDSYPVCNTPASVDVVSVSDGIVVLGDGATIPSGGTLPLSGSACMVAVTSGGDEGTTGYAEIRVTC